MRTYPQFVGSNPAVSPPQHPMASAATAGSQDRLAPPQTTSLQELSRSASPQQPNLNFLVTNSHPGPAKSHPAGNGHAATPGVPAPPPVSDQGPSTIHSILTVTKSPAQPAVQAPPWQVGGVPPPFPRDHTNALAGPSTLPQRASNKRKLDASEAEDPHTKIRRVVRDHVAQDPNHAMPMTTVLCLHAAVAQKSYGSEKRFLCPPPVVHIEGPVWHMKSQQLSMAVISEGGERSFEQKAPFDHNLTASFKFLHVTGSAKSKSFQLSLDIAEPSAPPSEGGEPTVPGRIWASFDSAPVTIISKPSKKTAKTRNISSCILAGGPVSLFNRINSQTVRTKYMTVEHTQLCASNTSWSAFNVNLVRSHSDAPPVAGPQPVTYGSEIVLSDTVSGTQTAPLIIRKVDKGRIAADDGGPVSQMQKIALQRVNPDGTRHYLSAAGPVPGTAGVVVAATPGLANQAGTHPLLFQAPRVREEVKDGVRVITDEVDDYLCWTIVGISKFQYTFFDAFGQNNTIPDVPITPFPTLFTAPVFRPSNNSLELTVANFFYEDPKTRSQVPLDIYIGNLGPLRHRVYQTSPPGPLTNISPFVQGINIAPPPHAPPDADLSGVGMPPMPMPSRYIPQGPLHTIVVVDMPPMGDIVKALEEDTSSGESPAGRKRSTPQDGEASGSGVHLNQQDKYENASIAGRSLPLLFIRSFDGVGYHSGRAIACENVFQNMDLANMGNPANSAAGNIDPNWLAAAQAAATADGGMHGWTLRVI